MTEPLIDPDRITEIAYAWWAGEGSGPVGYLVLDYLRSVLTPEALQTYKSYKGDWGENVGYTYNGADLHRRIFGEDQ